MTNTVYLEVLPSAVRLAVTKGPNTAARVAFVLAVFILSWPFMIGHIFLLPQPMIELILFPLTLWWLLAIPCVIYGHKARQHSREYRGILGVVVAMISFWIGYSTLSLFLLGALLGVLDILGVHLYLPVLFGAKTTDY